MKNTIYETQSLRNKSYVFKDRDDAGKALADMFEKKTLTRPLILGVPAGGVPVAARMAEITGMEMDVAIVSKITLPWNTEAGYGAVAFDGTVKINEEMVSYIGLKPDVVEDGIQKTREKVQNRVKRLRGNRPLPDLSSRTVILVDDGLASGFTMITAVEAVKNQDADKVVVAVPTGHDTSVYRLAEMADEVYCANIREGMRFAVAEAYEKWRDISEEELIRDYFS